MYPSRPATIALALIGAAVPARNSTTVPAGVIRPMKVSPDSVNQTLPSGPDVIANGFLPVEPSALFGRGNSVTTPDGVIRPIWSTFPSVNQRLPSGPVVMPPNPAVGLGTGNSVMVPSGVTRPIWLASR